MAAPTERAGLSGSITIQRFKIMRGTKARECLKHAGARLFHPKGGLDRRPIMAVPNSRRIVAPNLVIDVAQIELIKRWRFLTGSARTIKVLAVGSGFATPSPSDTDLDIPLDSKDVESWDDALITPDSTGLSTVVAQVLWLSGEANGVIAEIGLKFDDGSLVTRSDFGRTDVIGATQTNPVRITTTPVHGLATGDEVHLMGFGGMVELNNRNFTITVFDADEYDLDGEDGTGHTAYTSGGGSFPIVVKSASEVVQTDYRLEFTS